LIRTEAGGSNLKAASGSDLAVGGSSLEDAEKVMILSALERAGNNITKAAKELGVSRRTLHRKLKRYRA
jgi:two-component system response regulator HydG